jgi:hypothetical protein
MKKQYAYSVLAGVALFANYMFNVKYHGDNLEMSVANAYATDEKAIAMVHLDSAEAYRKRANNFWINILPGGYYLYRLEWPAMPSNLKKKLTHKPEIHEKPIYIPRDFQRKLSEKGQGLG